MKSEADKERLDNFILEVYAADVHDDKAFRSVIVHGMEILGLLDKDIAHEFNVCRLTISRWRNGVSVPHPAMREPIYNWLIKRAEILNG